jgi:hypothetical protein
MTTVAVHPAIYGAPVDLAPLAAAGAVVESYVLGVSLADIGAADSAIAVERAVEEKLAAYRVSNARRLCYWEYEGARDAGWSLGRMCEAQAAIACARDRLTVGPYHCPETDLSTLADAKRESLRARNTALWPLIERAEVVLPDFYWPWVGTGGLVEIVEANCQEVKRAAPGKRIVPFVTWSRPDAGDWSRAVPLERESFRLLIAGLRWHFNEVVLWAQITSPEQAAQFNLWLAANAAAFA